MEILNKFLHKVVELDFDNLLMKLYKRGSVQHFILNLNREEQLRKGINSEGYVLGFYRSSNYASKKQSLTGRKAKFGVVDLYYSGNFYSTFELIPSKYGFTIKAKTDLYDRGDFEEIYGSVLGLTDESIKKFREYILQIIIKELKKEIMGRH